MAYDSPQDFKNYQRVMATENARLKWRVTELEGKLFIFEEAVPRYEQLRARLVETEKLKERAAYEWLNALDREDKLRAAVAELEGKLATQKTELDHLWEQKEDARAQRWDCEKCEEKLEEEVKELRAQVASMAEQLRNATSRVDEYRQKAEYAAEEQRESDRDQHIRFPYKLTQDWPLVTDSPPKRDPTADWPLCAVCGKSAREGKHCADWGEGHDYVPGEER